MPTKAKLEEIAAAFVAEFGEHAAANTETGRLLGLAPDTDQDSAGAA